MASIRLQPSTSKTVGETSRAATLRAVVIWSRIPRESRETPSSPDLGLRNYLQKYTILKNFLYRDSLFMRVFETLELSQ